MKTKSKVNISARIDPETRERLKKRAKAARRTISSIIGELLKRHA